MTRPKRAPERTHAVAYFIAGIARAACGRFVHSENATAIATFVTCRACKKARP